MQINSVGTLPNFSLNRKTNPTKQYNQNFQGGVFSKIDDFRRKIFPNEENISNTTIVSKKHNNLCQDVFDGTTLRPEVQKKLKTMAEIYRFCILGNPKPEDLYIVGSMASYNYKPSSDIDLKLVLDYSKLINIKDKKQIELLEDDLYKTFVLFQVAHFDDINGHRIEVGTCPTTKIHTSGIYSIKQNKWLKLPNQFIPQIELSKIPELPKYKYYKNAFLQAIEKKDRMLIAKIYRDLQEFRIKALKEEGENSIGNLMFKALRNAEDANGENLFKQATKIMLGY